MNNKIARGLLTIGAVKFSPDQPFLYASGLRGPIYCDNRMLLSHPNFRDEVINAFLNTIETEQITFDLIGGIATAGIPYAAFVSDRLKAPMIYIRPKPKGHGTMKQVEGDYRAGQKVLLFEDLVNQGSSLEETISGTDKAQLQVSDCLCIVDYESSESQFRLKQLGIKLTALTNFTDLVETAMDLKLITEQGKKDLNEWHNDPVKWSMHLK